MFSVSLEVEFGIKMEPSSQSVDEVVDDIMKIHRSLPARPGIDEVEAAKTLIRNVEKEDQARLDAIAKQIKNPDIPEELFRVLQEMQKNLVCFHSKEQKREALKLLDLENAHALFDEFIQRASNCLSSSPHSHSASTYSNASTASAAVANSVSTAPASSSISRTAENPSAAAAVSYFSSGKESANYSELFTRDDSYVKKSNSSFYVDGIGGRPGFSTKPQIVDSSLKPATTSGGYNTIRHKILDFFWALF